MNYTKGLCSIVIPCWNAGDYIEKCFDSIKAQTYKYIEIIVVDNNSSDSSREKIRSSYGELNPIIVENPQNYGFAKAVNQGIAASHGEYVLSLNLDVILEKDFIEKMVGTIGQDHIGSASGKLYRFPEDNGGVKIIDTTGHVMEANRGVVNRGARKKDVGQYDDKRDIFGVCAAAGMYRREMLEDVMVGGQYFDEDYFASYEDVDLDWRAVLRGWRSVFVPEAVGYHKRNAFDWNYTEEMLSNSKRNKFLTTVKNDYLINYIIDFPLIFIYELEEVLYKHYKNYRLFFLSYWKMLLGLPGAMRKRFAFMKKRKTPPFSFRKFIVYEPSDIKKVANTAAVIALIIVLAVIFGAARVLLLSAFIFFVLNPLVYILRRRSH